MRHYQQLIVEATGCSVADAVEIEEIMRQDIFHSTLDWMSSQTLERAARLAMASMHAIKRQIAAYRAIQ